MGLFAENLIIMMWYLMMILLLTDPTHSKRLPECSTCKEIVDNFKKGLSDTDKSNYGGGNTNWEEKSLGSYAFSEVRLVEIVEKLCEDKSKECHSMLEKHEEDVETFWFSHFTKKSDKDFHTFFCVEKVEACCPNNTYGKDCSPCPGGVDQPCLGNGKCEGAGTRKGSGKCLCSSGYKGELCSECKDGYFEDSQNERKEIVCKVCHISCKGNCSGPGPTACEECKDGWVSDAIRGCQDINECLEEPCEDDQYCVNTQGSHSCFGCDASCVACTDSGPYKCNECKEGYEKLEDGKCEDKDECKTDSSVCSKENEECVNLAGSYQCICSTGYEYKEDQCVKSSKDEDIGEPKDAEAESEDSTSDVKEEL